MLLHKEVAQPYSAILRTSYKHMYCMWKYICKNLSMSVCNAIVDAMHSVSNPCYLCIGQPYTYGIAILIRVPIRGTRTHMAQAKNCLYVCAQAAYVCAYKKIHIRTYGIEHRYNKLENDINIINIFLYRHLIIHGMLRVLIMEDY